MKTNRTTINNKEEKDEQRQDMGETILWTVEEAAKYLNVCEGTIRRDINSGELPHLRIRGCIRLPKQVVLDWIEAQTRYNWGCVGTTCASTGEKPCQSLNVVMEEVEITTSMSDTDLEKRLNDLREHGTNG